MSYPSKKYSLISSSRLPGGEAELFLSGRNVERLIPNRRPRACALNTRSYDHVAEMAVWKYGRMSVLKDRSMKERKDGSSRKTEGWDGPSRPP